MDECQKDKELRREFFDTRTPDDPAYYSPDVMDIRDPDDYSKRGSKRGREMFERLKTMDWKHVLRDYLMNWIKGMKMLHVVDSYFNTGNSSPYQYGWYPHGYMEIVYSKLINMFLDGHPDIKKSNDSVDICYNSITVTRNLGYGKSVWRMIEFDIDFVISSNKKGIKYKYSVKASGANGFHDEFVQYAKDLKAELAIFAKNPLLKTDLRPYATYPDIASYKDPHDKLGIIKYFIRYDTVGRRDKTKFTQGFIDAYKDARDFCKGLPKVTFSESMDSLSYNGNNYAAEDYASVCSDNPDMIQHLSWNVMYVLIYKYGLLDTMIDHRFNKDTEIRQFIWHWHDKLHQPITDDIKAWVDKWIPKDRQKYVYGDA